MSQIPPASSRSSNDAHLTENRKRAHTDDDSSTPEGRESVRVRPLSWHPSAPVEPPLKSAQHRSIGVHSILNHPGKSAAGTPASAESGREGLGDQRASDSPSHSRFPSSSTVHLPSPSMHHAKPPPVLSPGMRNHHQNITAHSPSARFVNAGGYYPQKPAASQSPLAQLPGLQTVAPGSPLPIVDSASGHPPPVPSHQQSTSIHSTPTFASHRASTNQTPNASSKETSPTTPVSVFSQLGRSSPALAAASAPQSGPMFLNSSPYAAVDPITRLPSAMAGQRPAGEETNTGIGGSQPDAPLPGMIPCFLDLKSGSSSQAEKRKANSDASRRFRNRKRNEMQMEQKITSQQDEIRKQAETIQKQAQELQTLLEQCDFYHSERDFFREQVTRFVPSSQLPARPTSPRAFRPSFETTPSERDHQASWSGPDGPRKIGETASCSTATSGQSITPVSTPRPAGTWSAAPSPYPPGQMDEQPTRPIPQTPGTWTRSS
ncbi:hypothetical protein ARAM_007548 [Aspergillus rambellii]|uniref:BZIP domain-containing protein n=1 Tax=Aspergillus rambellii TaxID=308745 RepID=A0A0F8XIK5_9EURO|nr:hypothetical protein ARAM_007548 [Aspergillus rambellii]